MGGLRAPASFVSVGFSSKAGRRPQHNLAGRRAAWYRQMLGIRHDIFDVWDDLQER